VLENIRFYRFYSQSDTADFFVNSLFCTVCLMMDKMSEKKIISVVQYHAISIEN